MTKKCQLIILLIIFPYTCFGSTVSQGVVFHKFFTSVETIKGLKDNFKSHIPGEKIIKTDNKELILLGDGSELREEIALIENPFSRILNCSSFSTFSRGDTGNAEYSIRNFFR